MRRLKDIAVAYMATLGFAIWTGLAFSAGVAAMYLALSANLHAQGIL